MKPGILVRASFRDAIRAEIERATDRACDLGGDHFEIDVLQALEDGRLRWVLPAAVRDRSSNEAWKKAFIRAPPSDAGSVERAWLAALGIGFLEPDPLVLPALGKRALTERVGEVLAAFEGLRFEDREQHPGDVCYAEIRGALEALDPQAPTRLRALRDQIVAEGGGDDDALGCWFEDAFLLHWTEGIWRRKPGDESWIVDVFSMHLEIDWSFALPVPAALAERFAPVARPFPGAGPWSRGDLARSSRYGLGEVLGSGDGRVEIHFYGESAPRKFAA